MSWRRGGAGGLGLGHGDRVGPQQGQAMSPGSPAFTVVHAWTNHHTKPTSMEGKGSEQAQRGQGRYASAHQRTRASNRDGMGDFLSGGKRRKAMTMIGM